MNTDMTEIENMLSDIREWKKEELELVKERDKIDDRLEGIEDDISTTTKAIYDYIDQLSQPDV